MKNFPEGTTLPHRRPPHAESFFSAEENSGKAGGAAMRSKLPCLAEVSRADPRSDVPLATVTGAPPEQKEGGFAPSDSVASAPIKFAVDLFGQPILAPRVGRPGRPRHIPTGVLRDRVRSLRAAGMVVTDIAAAIGVSHPTLQLYYHAELGSNSQAWRRLQSKGSNNG